MSGRNKYWKGLKQAQRKFKVEKCEICGGSKTLQRHHKDGNRLNNSAENVQILCQECHKNEHMKKGTWGKGRILKNKICVICGKSFRPRRARDKICKNKECLKELGRISALKRWSSKKSQVAQQIGQTDLKPLEMDKFQQWLQQHGKS